MPSGKERMDLEHVLVAGGGSGGHVFPALAVAEQLEKRRWRVSWLGRVEGMERDLVGRQGLEYHGLPARAIVGRSVGGRVLAMTDLGRSSWRARQLIRSLEVGVVVGTGGYASAPGVMGAVLARRPAVLLEPNAVPGVANRWLSRFAAQAAIASDSAAAGLRCPCVETGVPVRADFSAPHQPADTRGPLRLLVLGGSQGARQLNDLLPPALESLGATQPGMQVTHQVGASLLDEARSAYARRSMAGVEISVVPFLDDVFAAMAAAHLIISRAGAITLAEICAVGRAALLLPLTLAGSHQLANARSLAATGGAEALDPSRTTAEEFTDRLGALVGNRQQLLEMGAALHGLARPQAAADIADLVVEVARKN